MAITLPPKIFKTLALALKSHVGIVREIKFTKFVKVFTGHFGCDVEVRKGSVFKVSPPAVGCGIWYWRRIPFFIHKPDNGCLCREDLYAVRKTLKNSYDWDHKTFAVSGGPNSEREQ